MRPRVFKSSPFMRLPTLRWRQRPIPHSHPLSDIMSNNRKAAVFIRRGRKEKEEKENDELDAAAQKKKEERREQMRQEVSAKVRIKLI